MLVAHIVFRFDYGGLENGVVNVINGLADGEQRHTVIALTEATEFSGRLCGGVAVHSLGKRPGKDFAAYLRLFRLLRRLKPDIVHTRNIGTMDCAVVAYLAGVPIRIHGEHGWDVADPDGTNRKYRFVRRILHRFVHRFVTVSDDLRRWLVGVVGIPEAKIQHICNGVDTQRFKPGGASDSTDAAVVVGSVTRFSAIKDPLNLVEAFVSVQENPALSDTPSRLLMIGDGELHEDAVTSLRDAGLLHVSSLPGSRDDIPQQLRTMDIFVLGSLREGISNTLLEAMASGLPVIACDTGGNSELIENDFNGVLVSPGNRAELAYAIAEYLRNPDLRVRHGTASRDRVVSLFSITSMVNNYRLLYEELLGNRVN